MKKKLLLLLIICFLVVGCGKKEEEVVQKPKLTLDIMAELIPDTYGTPKIKCSALDTNQVLGTLNNKLLLSDGYVYAIGNLFSNNEQCMKDSEMQFQKVLENGYLLGVDNKLYSTYDYKQNTYSTNISPAGFTNWVEIKFTEEEANTYKSYSENKKGVYKYISYAKFYVLKKDGNIYTIIYKIVRDGKTNEKTAQVVKEDLLYSSDVYGAIHDFSTTTSTIKQIDMLFTSNGLYVLKQIETEECMKYDDVICETKMELVTDYGYDKYKDEIKYYDKNYVITNNNSILSTKFVFNLTNQRETYKAKFADYEE